MVTKYRFYRNPELLALIDDKRRQSPLIDELCCRLEEEYMDIDPVVLAEIEKEDALETINFTCPVCEANLKLLKGD